MGHKLALNRWVCLYLGMMAPLLVAATSALAAPCLPGQVASDDTDGHCCWPGQGWLKSTGRCIGKPRCPASTVASGEKCIHKGPAVILAAPSDSASPAADSCPAGMTPIAGGSYVNGDGETIHLKRFCLDRTEVSAATYDRCATDGACTAADSGGSCNADSAFWRDHPANCLTWAQAAQFCKSRGKRLPDENEWEWAARGRDRARPYPWGDQLPEGLQSPGVTCWRESSCRLPDGNREDHIRTCRIGTHTAGATIDGIQDMAGNVAEWTATGDGESRVIRGGSYFSKGSRLANTAREDARPDLHRSYIGFRCAASLK